MIFINLLVIVEVEGLWVPEVGHVEGGNEELVVEEMFLSDTKVAEEEEEEVDQYKVHSEHPVINPLRVLVIANLEKVEKAVIARMIMIHCQVSPNCPIRLVLKSTQSFPNLN